MRISTNYLKNGCKAVFQPEIEGEITYSLEGEGSISHSGSSHYFIAPNIGESGVSTIKAVNDIGEEESVVVEYGSHLHVIADIIKNELGLNKDQIHMAWEKFKIPSDNRPYIYLISGGGNPVGNTILNSENAIQSMTMLDPIQVEIIGLKQSTLDVGLKIIMAMSSNYADRQMMINNIKIHSIPTSFLNVSAAEASSGLKRFIGTFNVFYNRILSNQYDYFDKFTLSVIEEQR